MKPSATQRPLVVVYLRQPSMPDLAPLLEELGAIALRVDSVAAARHLMTTRDSDMYLVEADDAESLSEAYEAARAIGYRPPIILAGPHIDDELAEQLAGSRHNLIVRTLDNPRELIGSWLVMARMHQAVRRYETEIPARAEEMDDLRRFTDELVATLPAKLLIVNEELQILFANRTALEFSDLDAHNVVGRPFGQLVPLGGEAQLVEDAIRRVLEGEGPTRLLGLKMTAPGNPPEERMMNVDIRACRLADQHCARVTLEDVSDEWRAQVGRLQESQKLQNVIDAIGAGVATLDADLRLTWTNKTFTRWFGHSIGMRCNEVCGRSAEECADCPARRAADGGGFESETWKIPLTDGRQVALQVTFLPIPTTDDGASLILLALDITEQMDRVEQLETVERVGEAVQGVLELDELLHMVLTCITTGQAFGFNRAFLFLRNRDTNTLDGRIAVGPASAEEAGRVWGELAARQQSLEDALRDATAPSPEPQPLVSLIRGLSYSLDDESEIVVSAFRDRHPLIVNDAHEDGRVTPDFRAWFGAQEFIVVPLISKGRSLGVVVADNLYNGRPITERDKALLQMFAGTAGLAIENAEAFADLKESITSLRRTRRQLVDQTKLAAVGRLAAHIAHEIRNPLATIGGFAHSIKNRPDNLERVTMGAGIIYEEVMRLEHMLSGIMDFSRPTRPLPARQSLNAVVDRTIDMLREQLPQNVRLSADTDPQLHEISLDAEQITQVIINLVRNAGDALGQDGGSIVVATRADPDGAVLTVTDDGPGVPKEIQQKIFEPFYSTKRGGTGLGLAVCRHIVAEHGGEMRIDSMEGRGSTFTLSLPDEPPPPPDVFDEGEEDLP